MKRHQSDKHEYSTIPQLLRERAQKNPDDYLQFYKDKTGAFVGVTYRTIFWEMLFFANGLLALGAALSATTGENGWCAVSVLWRSAGATFRAEVKRR